ncbi:predicted protein [Nematostella vectensis]|uniref:Uncharacterized protein n=1 Tax=Nematostella vectensis TaxID=45351 RepID=A7RTN0_NEMVE|nr:predicted protein [Nematostella vectensis]|eukprot:XP_001637304.1 predicted protein [Nematostella vectensis]
MICLIQTSAASRERPRTTSQSSIPGVAPPPSSQPAPAPAPPQPAPKVDLLADLGGDPFGQSQGGGGFGAFGQAPQTAQQQGFASFDAFGQQSAAPVQTSFGQAPVAPVQTSSFDPFGSTAPQQASSGFANFSQPQPIQQPAAQSQHQGGGFDAFGGSSGFDAFGSSPPSGGIQPSSSQGGIFGSPLSASNSFGPMISSSSTAPISSNPPEDKYSALSALDTLFGPSSNAGGTVSSSMPSSTGGGSVFGSSTSSSSGMASGPNPFASAGTSSGFPQQQPAQPSNPFQGLGNIGGSGGGGMGQMNGPATSMNPASSMSGGGLSSGGFGSFTQSQSSSMFGQPVPPQQSGWGGMQTSAAPQQNLSFGGAGMTALAANQFGKVPPQNAQMGPQGGFGQFGGQASSGMQPGQQGFGAQQAVGMQGGFGGMSQMGGAGQPQMPPTSASTQWGVSGSGGGSQWGSFGQAAPTSQSSGFGGQGGMFGTPGGQQSGFHGGIGGGGMGGGFSGQGGGFPTSQAQADGFGTSQGGFGASQGGFGASQGGFGAKMGGGMGGQQYGQPQQQPQHQQFGGWQQTPQQNPFMVYTVIYYRYTPLFITGWWWWWYATNAATVKQPLHVAAVSSMWNYMISGVQSMVMSHTTDTRSRLHRKFTFTYFELYEVHRNQMQKHGCSILFGARNFLVISILMNENLLMICCLSIFDRYRW